MIDSEASSNSDSAVTSSFKALVAGWSLIVVILSVAGYSYRWNYYYNFGLQSLVLNAPLESLPVYAIEIVRNPAFVTDVFKQFIFYLLPFHLFLLGLKVTRQKNNRLQPIAVTVISLFALDNRLLTDVLAAGIILFIAFQTGGDAGYRTYLENVVESTSPLSHVTVVAKNDPAKSPLLLACDTSTFKVSETTKILPFLGDPTVVQALHAGAACSTKNWSWRLLLRDEKFIYLFSTVKDSSQRPRTLVLPNQDELTLVFQ
jgi:hypothetical protein